MPKLSSSPPPIVLNQWFTGWALVTVNDIAIATIKVLSRTSMM